MKRTVWYCDVCEAEMPKEFTIIAWDLCPKCTGLVRDFLHGLQDARLAGGRKS